MTHLLDNQPTKTVSDEDNLRESSVLSFVSDIFPPSQEMSYQLRTSLHIQQIEQSISMIPHTRRGHCLGVRDVGVISIDKDARLGYVLRKKISRPEHAILMSPCLERMIVATTRVEAMDENEATQVS